MVYYSKFTDDSFTTLSHGFTPSEIKALQEKHKNDSKGALKKYQEESTVEWRKKNYGGEATSIYNRFINEARARINRAVRETESEIKKYKTITDEIARLYKFAQEPAVRDAGAKAVYNLRDKVEELCKSLPKEIKTPADRVTKEIQDLRFECASKLQDILTKVNSFKDLRGASELANDINDKLEKVRRYHEYDRSDLNGNNTITKLNEYMDKYKFAYVDLNKMMQGNPKYMEVMRNRNQEYREWQEKVKDVL